MQRNPILTGLDIISLGYYVSLCNYAVLLKKMERYDEAEQHYGHPPAASIQFRGKSPVVSDRFIIRGGAFPWNWID